MTKEQRTEDLQHAHVVIHELEKLLFRHYTSQINEWTLERIHADLVKQITCYQNES